MDKGNKKPPEPKRISLSSLRDFYERRKGLCRVIMSGLAGFLGWAVFYLSEKWMPFRIWRIFIPSLLFLVCLSLFILILRKKWIIGKH